MRKTDYTKEEIKMRTALYIQGGWDALNALKAAGMLQTVDEVLDGILIMGLDGYAKKILSVIKDKDMFS